METGSFKLERAWNFCRNALKPAQTLAAIGFLTLKTGACALKIMRRMNHPSMSFFVGKLDAPVHQWKLLFTAGQED